MIRPLRSVPRILYVWDADYPWDVRVEKICASLAVSGYEVHILARNHLRLPRHEVIDGVHVHRLPVFGSERVNDALSFPAFFNPLWIGSILRTVRDHKINLIMVRDLPLAPTAIWCARRCGLPIVFDMAEDYVAMLNDLRKYRKGRLLDPIVRNPNMASVVERYSLSSADHTLVVVDEAVDVALRGGASRERVTIVGNTPHLPAFAVERPIPELLNVPEGAFKAIYTGGLQHSRGLAFVIESIPKILQEIPNFHFVVVGEGFLRPELEALAVEKGVGDRVHFSGWVDHDEMYGYIAACEVGLVPHLDSAHVATTIPNKIFDYMGCGLPVVATDVPPLARLLSETGAGLVFGSGNAGELTRALVAIRGETRFGERGRVAVREEFNWHSDQRKLLDAVASVLYSAS